MTSGTATLCCVQHPRDNRSLEDYFTNYVTGLRVVQLDTVLQIWLPVRKGALEHNTNGKNLFLL